MKIGTSAKKLKVTVVVDGKPFAALRAVPDAAPARTEITVTIDGKNYTADVSTKSVRKAVKTLIEHGPDNVSLLVQGTLVRQTVIDECGLVANVKAAATAA